MAALKTLWSEKRMLCLIILGAIIVGIIVCVFLFGPKDEHVVAEATDNHVPDAASALDEAMTSVVNADFDTKVSFVNDSYMGTVYGVDAPRWLDAYTGRVKFEITRSDVGDEDGTAFVAVTITHPDTVKLSELVRADQDVMVEEDPIGWPERIGDAIMNRLSDVDDVESSEILTLVNEDGSWVLDEVSQGTVNRYLYGSVM